VGIDVHHQTERKVLAGGKDHLKEKGKKDRKTVKVNSKKASS